MNTSSTQPSASDKFLQPQPPIRKHPRSSSNDRLQQLSCRIAELEKENKELRVTSGLNAGTIEMLNSTNHDLANRCHWLETENPGPPSIPPTLFSKDFFEKLKSLTGKLQQQANDKSLSPAAKEAFTASAALADWSLRQYSFFLGVMQELRRQVPAERFNSILQAVNHTVSKNLKEKPSAQPSISYSEVPTTIVSADPSLEDPDRVLGWEITSKY